MSRIIKPISHFTQVSNSIVNDPSITPSELGVYIKIISKPDNWDFSCYRLAQEYTSKKIDKNGKETNEVSDEWISLRINSLQAKKYVYRLKLASGKVEYYMFNNPAEFDKFIEDNSIGLDEPNPQNARQAKHQAGETRVISNKESKKDLTLSQNKENFNLEEKKQEILANPLIPTLFNPITDLAIDEEKKDKVIDRAVELCVVEMMNKKAHNNQLFGYMRNCIQQAIKELDSTTKTNTTIQKAEYYQAKKDNPKFKTNNQQPQKSAWVQPEKPQPKMYYEEI
jgi:hypothetical protein